MSHPIPFRVYLPKLGRPIYTTGFELGKALFLHPKLDRFVPIFSPEVEAEYGKPIIQSFTGFKDKNGSRIFNGDVVYFHKFDFIGVVRYDETSGQSKFWLQMEDGYVSLVGAELVGEVVTATDLVDENKIKEFLFQSREVLKNYFIKKENL